MTVDSVAHEADQVAARLAKAETTWAGLSVGERRELLERFGELVEKHASEWIQVAARIKGLPEDSTLVGEEWISGPWAVLGSVGAMVSTLGRLERGEDVLAGFKTREVPGDRVAVEVLPHGIYDRLLLNGFSASVWMTPGVSEKEVRDTAGLGSRTPADTQGSTLVLGAGNIFSIAPLDTLYQLYAENRVVALKLNPITDPLKPVFEKIFAPYIELGVVEILTGGVEIGSALAYHPEVAAVHMTGSEQTHDAIVWGPGEEGVAAKEAGTPKLTKPITSELGGVAPVIVVPGKWSTADLQFQANHIATQRLHNSGSNCIAAQIVVLSSDWAQKEEFLTELRKALADAPERTPWYPGTADRADAARAAHPGSAEEVGGTAERTLITGLDLADTDETAFHSEYFGPVLGVTELPGTGADFLARAVRESNEKLRGTLGANIIIHPSTRKSIKAFETIIADLHYGTIGVNAWTGVGYLTACATWGAFPGHRLDDIQSGIGVVHNALLFAHPERTVVEGPFRPAPRSIINREWTLTPKPPWFVNNHTAATTGKRLTYFQANPRVSALPAVFASALRG